MTRWHSPSAPDPPISIVFLEFWEVPAGAPVMFSRHFDLCWLPSSPISSKPGDSPMELHSLQSNYMPAAEILFHFQEYLTTPNASLDNKNKSRLFAEKHGHLPRKRTITNRSTRKHRIKKGGKDESPVYLLHWRPLERKTKPWGWWDPFFWQQGQRIQDGTHVIEALPLFMHLKGGAVSTTWLWRPSWFLFFYLPGMLPFVCVGMHVSSIKRQRDRNVIRKFLLVKRKSSFDEMSSIEA